MIKKVLSASLLIGFLVVLVFPVLTSAAPTEAPNGCTMSRDVKLGTKENCPAAGQGASSICNYNDTARSCGICCTLNTLYGIVDWIFVILIALCALWIILGAYTLITAAGEPAKISHGRDYILYAAIGLAVALLAKAVPNIVSMVVGA